jgi:tetratricopeptide (TPR) repeat protein
MEGEVRNPGRTDPPRPRHSFVVRHSSSIIASVLLVLAALAVYWPVTRFEFINYDDPDYVTHNLHVQEGVTWPSLVWAFQTGHAANWHPLTWISHMLDVQFFQLNAGWHHFTNVCFHLANTLLLFSLLKNLTSAFWRSAFVAALFALHPLHVESVAWVSERKDVLSVFFGLLALWAYARFIRSKAPADSSGPLSRSRANCYPFVYYCLSVALFAASLMSKPMLVTFPFILLLLDYWPLHRLKLRNQNLGLKLLLPLMVEKLPFFALAAASSVATFLVQKIGHAVSSFETIPLGPRIANALISYVQYLGKSIWPARLALPYVFPTHPSGVTAGFAACLLLVISIVALGLGRRRPWLVMGWFWFLGTLLPVIGVIQVGLQSMADRYTYFPLIGLFILVTWTAADLLLESQLSRVALPALAVAILVACGLRAREQLRHWQDSETLFRHSIAVTGDNFMAHVCLGAALIDQGNLKDARGEFDAALKLKPSFAPALTDMAKLLYGEGQFEDAAALLREVLAAHPEDGVAHADLAIALAHQGKAAEALAHYRQAIRLEPERPETLNNLAWLLATHPAPEIRDGPGAVLLAERACQLTAGKNLWLLSTLAAAYAEAGRSADAVTTQQKVCAMAMEQTTKHQTGSDTADKSSKSVISLSQPVQDAQLQSFQRRLDLYRSGHAYRQE